MKNELKNELKLTIDGQEIVGTSEDILELLKNKVAKEKSGPKYFSESKGEWVLVSTMDDVYLVNACIKYGKEYLESLRGLDVEKFYEEILNAFYIHSKNTGNIGILLSEVEVRA